LFELLEERVVPPDAKKRLTDKLNRHQDPEDSYYLPFLDAGNAIQWLLRQPVRPGVVPNRIRAIPKTPRPQRTSESLEEPRPVNQATRDVRRDPATLLTSGVFRLNGETYIIVPTKNNKHIAKRWVKTPARVTTSGETVHFDWVAAPGVIWALYEEHRLPVADIEAMMIEHSVCIYPGCYRRLRAANSVRAGAGKRHCERLGIPWKKNDR